jgi:hypothetical protein
VSERHNDCRLKRDAGTDYPNLARKANSSLALSGAGKYPYDFQTQSLSFTLKGRIMKNSRLASIGMILLALLGVGLAQKAAQHLLTADELKKAVPTEFFFRGQKAPTQLRNSAGFQSSDGKMTIAALVDSSGYSTAIQQKYQGLLVTESKLKIGDAELAPGEYGFGFEADKFVVMNVANEDVLSVPFQTDSVLKRPVPLKMVEDGSAYKLYGGRKWVSVSLE